MAEPAILAALKLLGEALATVLVKKATSQESRVVSTISDLEARMNNISSELRVMQAFLDKMDMHDESNRPLGIWMGEIQSTADKIKDIVDEFMYLIGSEKFEGMRFHLKNLFKEPKSLITLKQIASQLEVAERSVQHLGEVKERWVPIMNAGIGSSANNANDSSMQVAISGHFIDEHEIIGFDETAAKLTSLVHSEEPNLSIISVWGMPGIGKTTLVINVFNRDRKNFSCHAWICISQTYNVDNVLRNINSEICKNEHSKQRVPKMMDTRQLKETVRNLLRQKRYLVVLDDMWDQSSFHDIRDVFVDCHKRSRVVITSRMFDVASLARDNYRLELRPLDVEDSWNLFCRKAFQFESNYECPPRLDKLAKHIILKCDGLPLALVLLVVLCPLVD